MTRTNDVKREKFVLDKQSMRTMRVQLRREDRLRIYVEGDDVTHNYVGLLEEQAFSEAVDDVKAGVYRDVSQPTITGAIRWLRSER